MAQQTGTGQSSPHSMPKQWRCRWSRLPRRKDELAKSAVLLGVRTSEHVVVVEDEKLPDSMETKWDPKLIASILTRYFAPKMMSTPSTTAPLANIDAIVTFDTGG